MKTALVLIDIALGPDDPMHGPHEEGLNNVINTVNHLAAFSCRYHELLYKHPFDEVVSISSKGTTRFPHYLRTDRMRIERFCYPLGEPLGLQSHAVRDNPTFRTVEEYLNWKNIFHLAVCGVLDAGSFTRFPGNKWSTTVVLDGVVTLKDEAALFTSVIPGLIHHSSSYRNLQTRDSILQWWCHKTDE